MARATFGGTADDFVYETVAGGLVRTKAGTLTVWDAETGGTQYTDLLLDAVAATVIPVGADGQVPDFQGPDGVYEVWVSAGGARIKMLPATNDARTAADIANPASATHAALSGTYVTQAGAPSLIEDEAYADGSPGQIANDLRYVQQLDLAGSLNPPFYIAHRGGGGLVYPEYCIEGVRAAWQSGFMPEADIWETSDGFLVLSHDASVDRTMNISGNISALTYAQFMAGRIFPQIIGGRAHNPMDLEMYLTECAGRVVMPMQVKTTGTAGKVIDLIVSRGLQRSVILFVESADVATAVAAGVNTGVTTDSTPAATLAAQGVKYVAVSTAATSTYVGQLVAAGITPVGWTINSPDLAATWFGYGVKGIYTDDPWRTSERLRQQKTREQFDGGILWPYNAQAKFGPQEIRLNPVESALEIAETSASGSNYTSAISLGMFGMTTAARTIRFKLQHLAQLNTGGSLQAKWAAIHVGECPAAGPHSGRSTESSLRFQVQRDGVKSIVEHPAGGSNTTVNATAAPGSPYAPVGGGIGTEYEYEITITSAGVVTLKNLTLGDTDATGTTSITVANWTKAYMSFAAFNCSARIKDIRVLIEQETVAPGS